MNLKCAKCGTVIEIPPDVTLAPQPRVTCPGCQTRYRMKQRPNRAAAASADGPTSKLPPTPTSPTAPGDTLTAPPVFNPGDVVARRYQTVRFLARGGMGEVYEAVDLELRENVALKTIGARYAADPGALDRFKREIALARKVTHPNVCRIFDLGQHVTEGVAPGAAVNFLTMELLPGETLASRLHREGRMSTAEALPVARQIAAGLDAAHGAGIVHRDLKSENVFLVPQGKGHRAVVTDFGIARGGTDDRFASMVTGDFVVGTPAYMAPEQVEGKEVTAQADLYAFGVVLYEIVTGRLPFESDNPITTAAKRLQEPPPPPRIHVPDLDPRWERTILRCLERDPSKRFATAAAVVDALAGSAAPAPRVTPAKEPPPSRTLKPLLATLGVVVLVSAALWAWNFFKEAEERIMVRRSVAVVGFQNLSGQADDDWLATALAEMLATELTRGGALRTVSGEQVARMRQETGLEVRTELSQAGLEQVHAVLGSDFVVTGSFLAAEEALRVDLRLADAAVGRQLASFAQEGTDGELFDLVRRLGDDVRGALEVGEGDDATDPLAGLPQDRQAARLYSEALDSLRRFEPEEARDALQEAARIEPSNPLVHSALSSAWQALGYGGRAAEEANRAFELSSGLPGEDRLVVEGRYLETVGDWAGAVGVYTELWELFPDELDYGLSLANAQTAAGHGAVALETVTRLGELPPPLNEDPRIALAEASAAAQAGDHERQLAAATRGAEAAAELGATVLEGQARIVQSQAFRFLARFAEAEAAALRAQELYAGLDQPGGLALALTNLANVHFERAELDTAIARFDEALALYRKIGDQGGAAGALNNLALAYKRKGDLGRADSLYAEAAEVYEATGSELGLANTLGNRAAILVLRDQLAAAAEAFERSLAVWEDAGNVFGRAAVLNNLAAVRRRQGRLEESRALNEEALGIRRQIGHRAGEVFSLSNLGGTLADLGELDRAEALLEEGQRLAEEISDPRGLAQCLYELAELRFVRGDLDGALELHRKALDLRRALDEKQDEADSQGAIARLHLERGEMAQAELQARHALAAFKAGGRRAEEGRMTAILALSLLGQALVPEARRMVDEASELGGDSEQLEARFWIGLAEARVAAAEGRTRKVAASLEALAEEARAAGFVALELEARLARAEIGGSRSSRQDLETLAAEAEQRGLGHLRDKAAAAL